MYDIKYVEGKGQFNIDNPPPSKFHKLKEDFYNFSGDEQYFLNTEKQAKETFKTSIIGGFQNAIPKGTQKLYQPLIDSVAEAFDNKDYTEVQELISTAPTLGLAELEAAKTNLLQSLEEYIGV